MQTTNTKYELPPTTSIIATITAISGITKWRATSSNSSSCVFFLFLIIFVDAVVVVSVAAIF